MRNCGRHIVLLVCASTMLAACGSGDAGDAGGLGNLPPIIQGTPVTTLMAGSAYSFTPTAADPDGDALTFTASGVPTWASFNATTGALTGTPTEANVGMTGMITIEVSDSRASTQLPAFRINVVSATNNPPGNVAPTITGTPPTGAVVGQVYSFVPVGDDADDDALTFSIQNRPAWATFTPATGQLTGTPAAGDVGTTNNIVISVSDGQASASLPAFNLTVAPTAPANRPPTITGTPPANATVGTLYSFRPVASDPDGNPLRFTVTGNPSWLSINATTGRLSGTPTSANVGTTTRMTISVTDNIATVSLPSFTIQVSAPANRPPVISGTPGTQITVGGAYAFQPSASDPDGNTLTFRIDNMPSWATFSTANGRLSGTPTAANVGTTANIVISVSDGTASTSLPAFSLAVVQAANGTAVLSWLPPINNTDGSLLTDLAGYRVAYGRAADQLDQTATVDNPGLTTYTVTNLSSGQWFFAVYAVNNRGYESEASNIGSKTIP